MKNLPFYFFLACLVLWSSACSRQRAGNQAASDAALATGNAQPRITHLGGRRVFLYEEILKAHEAGAQELTKQLVRKQFGLGPSESPDSLTGFLVACHYARKEFEKAARLVLSREGRSERSEARLRADLAACLRNYTIIHGLREGLEFTRRLRQEYPESELISYFWTVLPIEYMRLVGEGIHQDYFDLLGDNPYSRDPYLVSPDTVNELIRRYNNDPYIDFAYYILRDYWTALKANPNSRIKAVLEYAKLDNLLSTLRSKYPYLSFSNYWNLAHLQQSDVEILQDLQMIDRQLQQFLETYGGESRYVSKILRFRILIRAVYQDYQSCFALLEELSAVPNSDEDFFTVLDNFWAVAPRNRTPDIYRLYLEADSVRAEQFLLKAVVDSTSFQRAMELILRHENKRLAFQAYDQLASEALKTRNTDKAWDYIQRLSEQWIDTRTRITTFQNLARTAYRNGNEAAARYLIELITEHKGGRRLKWEAYKMLVEEAYAQHDLLTTRRLLESLLKDQVEIEATFQEIYEEVQAVASLNTVREYVDAAMEEKNKRGNRKMAIAIIDNGIATLPPEADLSRLFYLKVAIAADLGDEEEARQADSIVNVLVENYPKSPLVDDAMAELLIIQAFILNDIPAAERTFSRLKEQYPFTNAIDNAYNWLARAYRHKCRIFYNGEQALSACRRARELYLETMQEFPASNRFYRYAGNGLRMVNEYEKRILDYSRPAN